MPGPAAVYTLTACSSDTGCKEGMLVPYQRLLSLHDACQALHSLWAAVLLQHLCVRLQVRLHMPLRMLSPCSAPAHHFRRSRSFESTPDTHLVHE